MKTSILAMNRREMATDIMATSTTKITLFHSILFDSLNSFCSCFIKNAPRFARRRIAGRNSSFLYTAWGGMEVEEGDHPSIELSGGEKGEIARKLFLKAIDIDPRCSAAWLQLGVMEGKMKNYNKAKECFETVLTFDPKNSRVMQAYAVLESRNPKSQSRSVIELFERAVKASSNRGDAGTFQAYALYVAKLGDLDAARVLLRKGTEANPRHPAVWQAWGVLETRYGKPTNARKVFQQGIWNW